MRRSSLLLLLLMGCGRVLGLDDYELGDAALDVGVVDASRDAPIDVFDGAFDTNLDAFDADLDAFDAGGEVLQQVALGTDHTCAMTNRRIYCWGSNEFGQLGNDTMVRETRPVPIDGINRVDFGDRARLVAGHDNTCLIASDGAASCWGAGMQGQLGAGTPDPASNMPVPIEVEADELVIGFESMCAVDRSTACSSGVVCWGNDGNGRLGRGTNDGTIRAIGCAASMDSFDTLAGRDRHYCGLRGATPVCWGLNDLNQVRNNPSTAVLTPDDAIAADAIPNNIRALAVGVAFSCALNEDDEVRCWGGGGQGQLGDGTLEQRSTYPVLQIGFEGGRGIRQIAAGRAHVCAVDNAGRVHCWGQNVEGRLGLGDISEPQTTPVMLTTLPIIESIVAGDVHTCAISADNDLWCWGRNREGQIGNGETMHALSPVNVSVIAF